MATNEVFKLGDATSQVVPSGTASGAPVLGNGTVPGVALTAEGEGGNVSGEASVRNTGVWEFEIDGAVTRGAKVYITSAGALSTTASGNTLFGYAWAEKPTGTGPLPVRIAQV